MILFLRKTTVIAMVFCGIIIISQNLAAQNRIEKVVVKGSGLTEEKAIQNASQAAVQQVVGMYVVSDVVMENRELIKDQVLCFSNGFIRNFKTINKTKDEDGLISIEAEVEVETGILTNKLGELNIAVKPIGSDEFLAVSLNKFDSSQDFRSMADRVIFQPLRENKNVYDIKIISFEPISNDKENEIHWLDNNNREANRLGELKPFRLIFNINLNSDYLDSVIQFLDNVSKKSSFFFRKVENNIYINETLKFNFNNSGPSSACEYSLKSYELEASNFILFQTLLKNHLGSYSPHLIISMMGDNNSNILQTCFYSECRCDNRFGNFRICDNRDCLVSMNTLNISDLSVISVDSGEWLPNPWLNGNGSDEILWRMITGLQNKFYYRIHASYPGFLKNTRELSFIIFLNRDHVTKIKTVKLELLWLECGKKCK